MRPVLFFAVCAAAFAQTQVTAPAPAPSQDQGKEAVIRTTTTVVIAPTTVRDKKGNFVDGLQLQDFTLMDDGKPQKIKEDVRDEPLSLWFGPEKHQPQRHSSQDRENRNPAERSDGRPGRRVAVVAFDHRIQVAQDFTNEATKVSEALKNLKPGSTSHAVIDAEMECIRMLTHRPPARRRVLLIIAEKRDGAARCACARP